MFDTDQAVYQHLATIAVRAIPNPEWDRAEFEIFSHDGSENITLRSRYYGSPEDTSTHFNPYIKGDEKLEVATADLYNFLQKSPDDKPFNKYKFTLNNDGTFKIEFKYDDDFAYLSSLDAESQEFDDLLELEVVDQIESWEGLPEDFPRPWLVSA